MCVGACMRTCVRTWRCVCVCYMTSFSLPQLNAEDAAWAQVNLGGTALREARAELAEARKQWHCLQVEIESLHALVSTHTHAQTHHCSLSIAADTYSTFLSHNGSVEFGEHSSLLILKHYW